MAHNGRVDPEVEEARRSPEHWFVFGLAFLVPVALVAMALFFEPDARGHGTHEQLGLRPCTTMELWDVPCPGCGVTTSVTLAAQGRIWDSIVTQPFGFVCAVAGLFFFGWAVWATFRGRDLYVSLMSLDLGRWGRILVGVVLVSWVYKIVTV